MAQKPQPVLLDISWEALLKVLAFMVGIWLAVTLSEIIIMLFGVFILVAAVNPIINKWQKYMSRTLAVGLFYALGVAIVAVLASVFVPSLISQLNDLVHTLPSVGTKVREFVPQEGASVIDQALTNIQSSLSSLSNSAFKTTLSIFGGLATILTGIVLSFYLLLEEDNAKTFFNQVLPQHRFEAVYSTIRKISDRMGMWIRGQLLLMLIIGVANLIVYIALGVPSPLPLAIWAGLCEALPYIGPVIGVIPALAVSLSSGNIVQAVLVFAIGFVLIQQLEAHVVVPKVMSKAVGLSPVLVILAVAIGVQLFGFIGAVLAIPVAAIISVIVGEWHSLRKIWETE